MATAVDICNMALSQLGDPATVTSIDPPEGSAQADHCQRFYPVAVQEVLSEAPWAFATKRVALAALSSTPVGTDGTEYAFVVPSDCARIISVDSEEIARYTPLTLRYTVEVQDSQKVIIAKASTLWIKYVSSQVAESQFPAWFTTALIHRLATYLAGPVMPGSTGLSVAEAQMKLYEFYLDKAIQRNAREQVSKERYISPFHGDAQEENTSVFY